MKVILFEPEIPQNCGNIIRTCHVTGSSLTLVRPLGFRLSDRMLKRSGLDYTAPIEQIDDLDEHLKPPFYFFSSHATKLYTEVEYTPETQLIFGSESSGLPEKYFQKYPEHFVTLPMVEGARCLNLSNTVAIALYEGYRQLNFAHM